LTVDRTVVGASVRGTVHRRDGVPNQDAVAWAGPSGHEGRVVAAVSDGHGSPKAFRSRRGAQLAVKVGVEAGAAFLERLGRAGLGALDHHAWAPLTREIVDRWAADVRADLAAGPLREHELATVAEIDGPSARRAVESDPTLAYGATLLLVAVMGSFALFLQLGDGDILVVPAAGRVARPLRDDPRLFANETTSLCMPDAAREFRVACQPLTGPGPQVLLLATDGLANAYQDDTSFLQIGTDLLARIGAVGMDAVAAELEAFLQEAAEHSGDDVTVAVVWLGR
jgi:serine/threonine protein phosphatase PrpC